MSSLFDTTDLSLVNLFYFNNHNNHPVDLLVGEIIIWPTDNNYPKGFLLCDGGQYSTTEYNELYDIIGSIYGSGTGTFKVPDFRNKHIRGGNMQGTIQFGQASGNNIIASDNLPSHTHEISPTCTYTNSTWSLKKSYQVAAQTNTDDAGNYTWTTCGPTPNQNDAGGNTNRSPLRGHSHPMQSTPVSNDSTFADATNITNTNHNTANLNSASYF